MEEKDTLLFLVRHGETEWNLSRRYQGQTQIELNERGLRQAQLTAERLAKVVLHAAYASDLNRARATADIIAAPHGLKVTLSPALRERNFGVMEGMTRAEAMLHPWWSEMQESDGLLAPPGGETRRRMRRRVVKSINGLVASHPGQNVLVVTHGGPIAQLVAELLGAPARRRAKVRLANCSLSVIRANPRDKLLMLLNDVSHLYPDAPIAMLASENDELR